MNRLLDSDDPDEGTVDRRWTAHADARDRKWKKQKKPPSARDPSVARGPTRAGVVVEANRRHVLVDVGGDTVEALASTALRGEPLAVGDDVVCTMTEPALVVRVSSRRTCLTRRSPHRPRPVAVLANVDVVAIVGAATDPPFRPGLVDRYLLAVHGAGAAAVVVLNKVDEPDDPVASALLEEWAAEGVATVACSARTGQGLPALREALGTGRSALVGHSGVGKSSLVAALTGEAPSTGDLAGHGRGRHTTTGSRLYGLPGGGELVDTPGVRSFAPDDPSLQDLDAAFPDLARVASGCPWRGCTHTVESGCAVLEAVDAGALRAGRLARYQRLRTGIDGPVAPRRR